MTPAVPEKVELSTRLAGVLDDQLPRVMTPRMVADRWHCSERHIYNLVQKGELSSFRIGAKLVRIRGEDVQAFEAARSPEHSPPETGARIKPIFGSKERRPRAARLDTDPIARARIKSLRHTPAAGEAVGAAQLD